MPLRSASREPLAATAGHNFIMTQPNDNSLVKILFRFYSNVLDEWTIETMWAEVVDKDKGLYKIDNIPFYASIASDDIVFAEYDDIQQMLTYRETIEQSGNSIIQVVIMDKSVVTNDVRDMFNALGCQSEKFREGYFVLEVPADTDYKPVKGYLNCKTKVLLTTPNLFFLTTTGTDKMRLPAT